MFFAPGFEFGRVDYAEEKFTTGEPGEGEVRPEGERDEEVGEEPILRHLRGRLGRCYRGLCGDSVSGGGGGGSCGCGCDVEEQVI